MGSSKILTVVTIGAVALAFVGCSNDDDGPTAEEQFCAAGATLRTDVESLADIDVLSSGLTGVTEKADLIRADVTALKESGLEIASDEINELESALVDFEASLSVLDGNLSIDKVGEAFDAVGRVVGSAAAVFEIYTTTCTS